MTTEVEILRAKLAAAHEAMRQSVMFIDAFIPRMARLTLENAMKKLAEEDEADLMERDHQDQMVAERPQ